MKNILFWRCHPCNDNVPKAIEKCPACGFKPKLKVYFEKEFSDQDAAEIIGNVKFWKAGQDFHDDIHKAIGPEND
jgi:hypothetical protein